MYSSSHRQAGNQVINIQSTLRTAPDLRKNISIAVLFGSNGNSYIISTQSDMCKYTRVLHEYRDAGGAKEIEQIGTEVNAILGTRAIGSSALV